MSDTPVTPSPFTLPANPWAARQAAADAARASSLLTCPELESGASWGDIFFGPLSSSSSSPPRDFSVLAPARGRRVRFGPSRRTPAAEPEPELAPEPEHGHGERTCESCERPGSCDCPCELCISTRHYSARTFSVQKHRSPYQEALDRQWENANLGGPGCPFCDAIMGGCRCWAERAEMHRAAERAERRADRAALAARIARGECTCDSLAGSASRALFNAAGGEDAMSEDEYGGMCEVCEREEALRCRECGQLQCPPECCGGCGSCERCCGPECSRCHELSDRCCCHEDDHCPGCSPGCSGCDPYFDPSDPWGDGAPEEHRDDDWW